MCFISTCINPVNQLFTVKNAFGFGSPDIIITRRPRLCFPPLLTRVTRPPDFDEILNPLICPPREIHENKTLRILDIQLCVLNGINLSQWPEWDEFKAALLKNEIHHFFVISLIIFSVGKKNSLKY